MDFVLGMDAISLGLLASLEAGLATGLGAIPTFFLGNAPVKIMDGFLGFSVDRPSSLPVGSWSREGME